MNNKLLKKYKFSILIYIFSMPILTFFSAFFNNILLKRLKLYFPGYPNNITIGIYTPSELTIFINSLDILGIVFISGICLIIAIISIIGFKENKNWVFYTVIIFNLSFLCFTLIVYIHSLLRLLPIF